MYRYRAALMLRWGWPRGSVYNIENGSRTWQGGSRVPRPSSSFHAQGATFIYQPQGTHTATPIMFSANPVFAPKLTYFTYI
jgi:hypothetical protein